MASSTYKGIEESFGVSQTVAVLSVSLFVAGLGCGPREHCCQTVELILPDPWDVHSQWSLVRFQSSMDAVIFTSGPMELFYVR